MVIGFNADEVFEMAIRIEENGAAFYKKAAGLQSDTKNREFLGGLAAMEYRHKETFTEMRKALTEKEKAGKVFDPYDELSLYLSAMAEAHGGEGSPSVADSLTGNETMEDIINTALDLEKKSILFYLGLKDMVAPKYGQDRIEEIIAEERRHIVQLTKAREKITAH